MLTLKIVSPERVVYDGPVVSVLVPGTQGQFEILNQHAPIISSLEEGKVVYTTADGKQELSISKGFVSVKKNCVSLCVEIL